MLEKREVDNSHRTQVSVAGCLGYDVLDSAMDRDKKGGRVSVAGCLGYDVLESLTIYARGLLAFQLLVV